ncbi:MAG: HAD family phosphatase [Alphaproteobacteria bacterium]|nr:HAD family phosphatase [Alphaproteobacteria bacterium]
MTQIKAVLFDMDGVLVDATEWHFEALNRALALFGLDINRFDHLDRYDGLPTKRKLEMLSREFGLPPSLHQFVYDLKQKFTLELVRANCHPNFDHQFALSRLHGRGLKLGVCSNAIRESVETIMEAAGLARFLDVVLSNEDVRNSKPDPEIYLKAYAALGLDPRECLIIEDNDYGVASATASGGHVFRVGGVSDVNYRAIMARINRIEDAGG